jgi:tetratricopeptide (TPR) repeat protein
MTFSSDSLTPDFPDRAIIQSNYNPQPLAAQGLNALALLRTKNYPVALAKFDRYIELYPQDAHGYCYRGICYQQLQAHPRALADFNMAIELKPVEPVFHHARGVTYQQLGNFLAAIADYDLVIQATLLVAKIDDDAPAEISYLQGDLPQKIAVNPLLIDAYFRRGMTHTELGNCDRALVDYDRIILLDPAHVRAYIQRSWIYFRQGKYPPAIQDCETVKTIDKVCFWANYLLGVINALSGLPERAIADFTVAIELSPNYVSARYHRGIIYYELGNTIEAIADFDRARTIQDLNLEKLIDRDETGFYAEGLALYYTGQLAAAIAMLEIAFSAAKRLGNLSFQSHILLRLQQFKIEDRAEIVRSTAATTLSDLC